MKILKIVLIIVLLTVMLSSISSGTGSITSGDKTICLPPEEFRTLDEWFYNLKLSEKIEIYNNYEGGK